jgi:hypothetical protein
MSLEMQNVGIESRLGLCGLASQGFAFAFPLLSRTDHIVLDEAKNYHF